MKLLIDTQSFVWLINEDPRLGDKASTILRNPSNQLHLSYFSIFEMVIKASIGKLEYDATILNDLPKMGIDLLLPGALTLKNYTVFNPNNKDPFDNALIAIAIDERCVLVTSDSKILTTLRPALKLLDATK